MNYITCPKCKHSVSSENDFCSVCNFKFDIIIDEPIYIKSENMNQINNNYSNKYVERYKKVLLRRLRSRVRWLIFKVVFVVVFIVAIVISLLYQ